MKTDPPVFRELCLPGLVAVVVCVAGSMFPSACASADGLPPLGKLRPFEIRYGVNTIPSFSTDGATGTNYLYPTSFVIVSIF